MYCVSLDIGRKNCEKVLGNLFALNLCKSKHWIKLIRSDMIRNYCKPYSCEHMFGGSVMGQFELSLSDLYICIT